MLFDKHERPILRDMSADAAWAACEAYEDYVYNSADSFSDEQWDDMLDDVRALYDEYYGLFD